MANSNGAASSDAAHQVILISQDQADIDGQVFSLNQPNFNAKLTAFAQNNDSVILSSAPDVKVQFVIALLDKMIAAGIDNLNLRESTSL